MSQSTITEFFNSRKRSATEDIVSSKSKVPHLEHTLESKASRRNLIIRSSDIIKNDVHGQHLSHELKVIEKKEDAQLAKDVSTTKVAKNNAFAKKINAANVEKPNQSKSEAVSLARKELNLGDIKKRLAGSSRLAELKASAERLSKGIQELKESSAKRNLKEFKTIDVEVPLSPSKRAQLTPNKSLQKESVSTQQRPLISPRKVVVSPVKSPSKVPAYIRHAALATTSTSLPLPHHYRFLAELFRGMETVVALLYNRNEKITFAKLKPSVQEMLKRSFTEKHLSQIKHLVPDFYNFEVQKIKSFSATCQKDAYELAISPNFPTDIKVMNPTVLLERRRYFFDILLQLVKKYHSQFLQSLDPPMTIPEDKLTRWHPEFEVEKVPEVECAKLPEIPSAEKYSTAHDVLAKARELFKCNTKMERALEKLAQAKARGLSDKEKATVEGNVAKPTLSSVSSQANSPSTSNVTILNPALRNLPAALLEKVKAKQAAKALEAMTRSSEDEKKYLIYSRLPDLARTMRNIFVTERKNVLALNIILSKLDSSFKSNVNASDLQRDIKELTNLAPEWIKLHEIRNTTYLKLDKTVDLKKIISKLEDLVEKYRGY